ncbi:MAG: hypothetical protein HWD57_23000 [Candidatus Accumulibacter cognatus]|uniref:Uncharacterized protein n=1 Tax=Candidatus Accumulibacter cognatus TaxID=2954383 RepID=A0A7D5SB19_9PROT|nr:MAG: hypothetical protein HWD57_23000 [Candidatus Accumulibacter cognatus]
MLEFYSPLHQTVKVVCYLFQYNRVRVIITKQALQEGWDWPFAYVL